jgi:hypothetical protein
LRESVRIGVDQWSVLLALLAQLAGSLGACFLDLKLF